MVRLRPRWVNRGRGVYFDMPPELLLDVPPAPVVELDDDPPVVLPPVPPLVLPVPLVVSVELPGVPGAPPMPLVLLLVLPPGGVVVAPGLVVELDELELGGVVVVVGGGTVVVVSSFLVHAAADNAIATAVAIKRCLLIARSSLQD